MNYNKNDKPEKVRDSRFQQRSKITILVLVEVNTKQQAHNNCIRGHKLHVCSRKY